MNKVTTREKVSYILVVQDFDSTTAAIYDTSYKVEQQKNDKILTWVSKYFRVLHYCILCNAMLSSSSLPSSSLHTQSHNCHFSQFMLKYNLIISNLNPRNVPIMQQEYGRFLKVYTVYMRVESLVLGIKNAL